MEEIVTWWVKEQMNKGVPQMPEQRVMVTYLPQRPRNQNQRPEHRAWYTSCDLQVHDASELTAYKTRVSWGSQDLDTSLIVPNYNYHSTLCVFSCAVELLETRSIKLWSWKHATWLTWGMQGFIGELTAYHKMPNPRFRNKTELVLNKCDPWGAFTMLGTFCTLKRHKHVRGVILSQI